jgi:hypothetical protein
MNFAEQTLAILVIEAGHVLIARVQGGADGTLRAYNARTIRSWGTTKGLGELYDGPTKDTILDARVPLILQPLSKVIYVLPVSENAHWGV